MITVCERNIDEYIQMPTVTHRYRARSVVYTLDGTAKEDRLGGAKKILTLPFVLISGAVWEDLRDDLIGNEVAVSGNIGSADISGVYRLYGNDIPTPILVVEGSSSQYVCQPFTVTLEEI